MWIVCDICTLKRHHTTRPVRQKLACCMLRVSLNSTRTAIIVFTYRFYTRWAPLFLFSFSFESYPNLTSGGFRQKIEKASYSCTIDEEIKLKTKRISFSIHFKILAWISDREAKQGNIHTSLEKVGIFWNMRRSTCANWYEATDQLLTFPRQKWLHKIIDINKTTTVMERNPIPLWETALCSVDPIYLIIIN